jgi:hypothetical protein
MMTFCEQEVGGTSKKYALDKPPCLPCGQTLEATLLTPSNIPPSGYGRIYRLLLGPLENYK